MANEDAKRLVKDIRKIDLQIKHKLEEREMWRSLACKVTSSNTTGTSGAGEAHGKMSNAIDNCIDIEREIDELVDELVKKKREVIKYIDLVWNPLYYEFLVQRYINGLKLREIAELNEREYTWASTTHQRAIMALQKAIEDERIRVIKAEEEEKKKWG